GGAGAIAGAVDVGIMKNNVNAEIKTGANVTSKDSVHVNALGIKDLTSIAVSGAVGAVGLAGAGSVWSVGSELKQGYTGDGGSSHSALEGGADYGKFDPGAVDTGANTIQLGSDSKLKTGDAVVYRVNPDGGSGIAQLTDGHTYYVRDFGSQT